METPAPGPLGGIPMFSQPEPMPAGVATMDRPPSSSGTPSPSTTDPSPSTSPPSEARRKPPLREQLHNMLGTPKPDTAATPTTISAGTGEPKPVKPLTEADVIKAMIGALGVLVMAGGFLVKQRYAGTRTLRKPTPKQEREIATPAASIMMRHAKLVKLAPDLFDSLALVAAGGNYLNDGPLTLPRHEPGDMPQMED